MTMFSGREHAELGRAELKSFSGTFLPQLSLRLVDRPDVDKFPAMWLCSVLPFLASIALFAPVDVATGEWGCFQSASRVEPPGLWGGESSWRRLVSTASTLVFHSLLDLAFSPDLPPHPAIFWPHLNLFALLGVVGEKK